jgi:L-lactate dehydrogenase complex protein LldF
MAACPVEINIPDMLLKLRRDLVKEGDPTFEWKAGMKMWQRAMQSPRLFMLGVKMAQAGTGVIAGKSGKIRSLPPPFNAWTNSRDFPAFPKESFRERYAKRKKGQQG